MGENEGLMRVTVEIGKRRFVEDLTHQLSTAPDLAGIDDVLLTNAARWGEWAMMEQLAVEEVDSIKLSLELLDSDMKDLEAALMLTAQGSNAEARKAAVRLDPRVHELEIKRTGLLVSLNSARGNVGKLGVGKSAVDKHGAYTMKRADIAIKELNPARVVRTPEELALMRPGETSGKLRRTR